jgi:predicted ATP-grasp superfamily ATP-dependent carboligase
MDDTRPLLIVGASVRAAAFSALRAGLRPWCMDLFADADLRVRCPAAVWPLGDYRHHPRQLMPHVPPGPWMYTGALENHRRLVQEVTCLRPLWGNGPRVLQVVRSPWRIAQVLTLAGVPHPAVSITPPLIGGAWLVKPLAGSAGRGIARWPAGVNWTKGVYFQEYLQGDPCAAVYVGDGRRAELLGVTRQLIGEPWLHAAPFHYCGSIGPLRLDGELQQRFEQLGHALVQGCGLRGLFGVDAILRENVPWPVEVNPRYTASVEVHEYATGLSALTRHGDIFDPQARRAAVQPRNAPDFVGKAILFARETVTIPAAGPWSRALEQPVAIHELPAFADIPPGGQTIKAGSPILTFFARAASVNDCLERLRQIAQDLDRWLFGR